MKGNNYYCAFVCLEEIEESESEKAVRAIAKLHAELSAKIEKKLDDMSVEELAKLLESLEK